MSQASRHSRTLEAMAGLGAGLNPGRAVGSNLHGRTHRLLQPGTVIGGPSHGGVRALAGQGRPW